MFDCHHGKDRHKKRRNKKLKGKKPESDHSDYSKKKRFLAQPTKKMDCPVQCSILEIFKFPGYKLDEQFKYKGPEDQDIFHTDLSITE